MRTEREFKVDKRITGGVLLNVRVAYKMTPDFISQGRAIDLSSNSTKQGNQVEMRKRKK